MTHVVFACTFNTTWADDFAADFEIAGFPIVRTGTVTGTADAYGTLILPSGTFTDVLRATYVEDHTDAGFVTITAHREYTHYMKAGTHYPLAHIYSFSTTVMGNTTVITGAQWMDAGSTGLLAAAAPSAEVEVYPVPASDVLFVRCPGEVGSITLSDMQGRTVALRSPIGVDEAGRIVMDTRALPGGTYLLRVVSEEGTFVRPVFVAR